MVYIDLRIIVYILWMSYKNALSYNLIGYKGRYLLITWIMEGEKYDRG